MTVLFHSRSDVELTGKRHVEVLDHPLGPQCRMLGQFWLVCDPDDHGFTPHAKHDGFWEAWITYWVDQQLTPDTFFVDVGANHGYYSLQALAKGASVMAFEPQQHLVERINAARSVSFPDGKAIVIPAAVGDRPGAMTLQVPTNHGMNASLMYLPYSPKDELTSYEVEVQTLDATAHQLRRGSPMLIKIDAEGAEPLVWCGMDRLWREREHVTVLLEFRWDRYDDPVGFATELFREANVGYVDYAGHEVRLESPTQLATKQHEDWMLVLRQR